MLIAFRALTYYPALSWTGFARSSWGCSRTPSSHAQRHHKGILRPLKKLIGILDDSLLVITSFTKWPFCKKTLTPSFPVLPADFDPSTTSALLLYGAVACSQGVSRAIEIVFASDSIVLVLVLMLLSFSFLFFFLVKIATAAVTTRIVFHCQAK